jgi:hypothetical protein
MSIAASYQLACGITFPIWSGVKIYDEPYLRLACDAVEAVPGSLAGELVLGVST